MTETELDEIEQRAAKATPGPWTLAGTKGKPCPVVSAHGEHGYQVHSMLWVKKHGEGEYPFMLETYCRDAAFIAAARQDVPSLVAELRRARELLRGYVELTCRLDDLRSAGVPRSDVSRKRNETEEDIAEFLRGGE